MFDVELFALKAANPQSEGQYRGDGRTATKVKVERSHMLRDARASRAKEVNCTSTAVWRWAAAQPPPLNR